MKPSRWFLSALVVALLVLAIACGDDDDNDNGGAGDATNQPTASGTGQPVGQQGNLTLGWSNLGNESLSPVTISTATQDVYLRAMFDPLVFHVRTEDGRFEEKPGLADTWEQSDDGLTWTFHLNPDATFHNDDPVTADDVIYSFDLYRSEMSTNTLKSSLNADIASITAVDEKTVEFTTNYIIPQLPLNLADIQGSLGILPKRYIEEVGHDQFARTPIGSGPFKFVRQTPGSSILFEAVPQHYRKTASYAQLEFRILPEPATRVNALVAGEVDAIDLPIGSVSSLPDDIEILEAAGETAQWLNFGGLYEGEPSYDPNNPFTDVRVREAMNLAIDRDALVEAVYSGYAKPAAIGYWNSTDLGYPQDVDVYPYDPERARELLAEAGYENGFSLDIMSFNLPPAVEMTALCEAVALMWEEIGLDVNIVPTDFATLRTPWGARELETVVWPMRGFSLPDRTNTVPLFWKTTGSLPIHTSAEYDELVDATTAEPDLDRRAPLIERLMKTTYESYSTIPGVESSALIAHRSNVDGWAQRTTGGIRIAYEDLTLE